MNKTTLLPLLLLLTACSLSQKTTRVAELPHVPVDYEILGDTSAEERRTSVFFVDWGHLFSDKLAATDSSTLNASIFSIENTAKSGALYKGLEKIPEADKIIEPRWQIDSFNVLGIYRTVNVQMWAKAIKYTRSAPVTLTPRPAVATQPAAAPELATPKKGR